MPGEPERDEDAFVKEDLAEAEVIPSQKDVEVPETSLRSGPKSTPEPSSPPPSEGSDAEERPAPDAKSTGEDAVEPELKGKQEIEEDLKPETQEEPIVSPDKVPFQVAIEYGRKKMTLGELSQLQPGNILNLGIRSDQTVYLVVNGKRVGSGELLQIGEALGLRVLEMG